MTTMFSKFEGTHGYSYCLRPDLLQVWAQEASDFIIRCCIFTSMKPLLFYTGMSGVGHATALSMCLYNKIGANFGMLYIRKEHEKTSNRWANNIEESVHAINGASVLPVFVDDLVSSGHTRRAALERLHDFMKRENTKFNIETAHYVKVLKDDQCVIPLSPHFGKEATP